MKTTHKSPAAERISYCLKTSVSLLFLILNFHAASASDSERWLKDSIPAAYQLCENATDTIPTAVLPPQDLWWGSFHDPLLTDLIKKAVDNNYDLLTAVKRIELARVTLKSASAAYFPTIGLSGSWTRSRASGKQEVPYSSGDGLDYFSVGLNANWEIDLFGRVHQQAKASRASLNASKADFNGVMLSVAANVATTYFQLRTYQEQLEVALQHIDGQERVVALTEARFEAGLVSALDVAQARNVLLSTKATIPKLRAMISSSLNALATLTGVYASDLDPQLSISASLPSSDSFIEIGVPAGLLRRRPDIIAAEYNLEALAAQVGIAKKEFLPHLSISGSVGTVAHRVDGLFSSHSFTYSVTPQLSWTVFDGLARNYAVAEAKLNLEAAVDSYNQTVMSAIEDVNNCLSLYSALQEQTALYKEVCNQSKLTLQLAVDRYKLGLSDFTNVANAQMTLLSDLNSLISSQGSALTTLVSLYESLGGGWKTVSGIPKY